LAAIRAARHGRTSTTWRALVNGGKPYGASSGKFAHASSAPILARCSESALKRPCSTTLIVTWYTAIRRPSPRRQCPRNCSIIAPAVGRSPSSHAATSRRTSAATSRRASTPLYSLGRDAPDRPLRRQDSNLDHRNQNPAGPVCSGRRRFLTSGYVFGTHCGGVSRLVTVAVNSRCQGLSGTVQAQPRSRWMAEQSPWTVPSSHDETTTETTL